MVRVLDSGSSGPDLGRGWGNFVVFLGKTLVPPSTQVYKWVPAKMLGVTLRWTSIPTRGSRNAPICFMLPKPDISAGLMGLLARKKRETKANAQFPTILELNLYTCTNPKTTSSLKLF